MFDNLDDLLNLHWKVFTYYCCISLPTDFLHGIRASSFRVVGARNGQQDPVIPLDNSFHICLFLL